MCWGLVLTVTSYFSGVSLELAKYRSNWRSIARTSEVSLELERYRPNQQNIARTGEVSLELAKHRPN